MSKKIFIIGIIVIAVGAGAWMLTRNNYSPSDQSSGYPEAGTPQPSAGAETQTPPANPQTGQPTTTPTAPTAAAVKEFTVTGQNFSFAPSTLTVKKGDTVKIIFKNADGTHDLRIDEFNAATKRIRTGEQETITFVADKAGSFEFYCSVGSHRQMGMKGTLTVTE